MDAWEESVGLYIKEISPSPGKVETGRRNLLVIRHALAHCV